ncbi:methionine aminotransferase [Halobacteriovorax sp.]|uniref:methionine aminotransferase n=1 Tax=Halobacteriovorax sp. TaxID=2020862 RepID=UPI003565A151
MIKFNSKLPNVGQTIFTTITAKANALGALNLGQGFPDFDGDSFLKDRICHYIEEGFNQYAPMTGVPELRNSIASYFNKKYKHVINADTEITITSGATEALTASILAFVSKGDEVIVFDPCYDSYVPAIELAGGSAKRLNLVGDGFSLPFSKIKETISDKTRMIIINSPHNPTGTRLKKSDWIELSKMVDDKNIILLSDEVYEGICFDEEYHFNPRSLSSLEERLISVYSFGKSCHMTGWKVGYLIAKPSLTLEVRKLHQYITFSTFTAAQMALADFLSEKMETFLSLGDFYKEKRDFLVNGLKESRFKVINPSSTYFCLLDYSNISKLSDVDFCLKLIEEHGIATIPISGFYENAPEDQKIVRVCFAKDQETLARALDILNAI